MTLLLLLSAALYVFVGILLDRNLSSEHARFGYASPGPSIAERMLVVLTWPYCGAVIAFHNARSAIVEAERVNVEQISENESRRVKQDRGRRASA